MVDWIVTVFVVLAVFAVVASLLTLYVWRADSQQFAVWMAALLSKRKGRDASTRQSVHTAWPGTRKLRAGRFGGLRNEVVSGHVPPDATMTPVSTSEKSAAARLQYWLEIGRYARRAP
jgi:hypothetical protein